MVLFFASPALYPMSSLKEYIRTLNEFHPFPYFVETSRYFANLDSVILRFRLSYFCIFLILLIILTIRGYSIN